MILKVLKRKIETRNSFSLILEKPAAFNFYPGQYLDVKLANDTRTFTISSSPTENFIMITAKKGRSRFKKMMEKLKIGDLITTSHPAGTFTLDESTPAVFIAGGIGITPFRSIIKSAVDKKLPTSITLIYSNSDNNFIFKDELVTWQKQTPNLKMMYHNSGQNCRLNRTQLEPIVHMYGDATSYLAGAPKMVDGFEKMLLDLGIDKTNIRYDKFDGY